MKTLLTGATGFVGGAVLDRLQFNDVRVLGRSRQKLEGIDFVSAEIKSNVDYSVALVGVDVIVHSAARAHIMDDTAENPLEAFREVNTLGTLNLVQQAADAGVKRFIFISSIKVNGEGTQLNNPYQYDDLASPEDAYGQSKVEAEVGLRKIAKETGMEVVIIRPPLVYGPGVKGNFLNLLKLSKLSIPLPFGSINNKRSMVYLDNLVDLIVTCIAHPNAANNIFLASDGDDLSLARLMMMIRRAMNKSPLLLPVPMGLFRLIGRLSGKTAVVDRLVGNLQVDCSDAKKCLGWSAPYTVEQGIKATVDDFLIK